MEKFKVFYTVADNKRAIYVFEQIKVEGVRKCLYKIYKYRSDVLLQEITAANPLSVAFEYEKLANDHVFLSIEQYRR
jgi:hypothetical protein